MNYDVCRHSEIPLYLIVAGLLLFLEILLHTVLYTCQSYVGDETTYRRLRRCDFIVLILFIWLLVGSNWMFRLGFQDDDCEGAIDGGGIQSMNLTVTDANGTITHIQVDVGAEGGRSGTMDQGGEDCSDCSHAVYVFTASVILIQYVAGLVLVAFCCHRFFRRSD